MGDGETWGQYLRRMTARSGWSVARLARESGVHRATIFGWISEGTPQSVKLDSVRAIADALGDDLTYALRVAGEVSQDRDPEIERIREAHAQGRISTLAMKRLVQAILVRRAREEQARLDDLDAMIEAAAERDGV